LSILKILIDYSLFEKYDKEYFIKNLIIPIFEDSISLKFAVCINSNLGTIKDDFVKVLNFIEVDELEILFILANLENRQNLYKIAQKSIVQNSSEKYTAQFLDELILYSLFWLSNSLKFKIPAL